MATTVRELESPDAAARTARHEDEVQDMIGEKLVINMGPSHPATHGVLRLVLELDGEIITKADPDVGFLHRGDEKIAENMHYNQFVPYTDRLDYLAPLANNVAYVMAVEKLMGWELPPRGQAIRVICCEMARISSHLLGVGVQTRDMNEAFVSGLKKFLDDVIPVIDEMDKLLSRNAIFLGRTQNIGVISKEDAIAWGISGPNLRGSGVDFDLRKAHPYLGYQNYDFD